MKYLHGYFCLNSAKEKFSYFYKLKETIQSMQEETIPVPRDRIYVLLAAKRNLARLGRSTIKVDSEAGEAIVSSDDPLNFVNTVNAVEAISRGFSTEAAKKLFEEGYVFEQIHIKEFAKTRSRLVDLRARIIGKDGKARRKFERMTNTDIVVYGKTVGIIGKHEDVIMAHENIERLLHGSPHSNVFLRLELLKEAEA